ncbi:hypothetical protein ED857_19595, partial [Acinetobacter baumannii]
MGWTLVDLAGRPRYWATVWSALEGAALAESTLSVRLASIDELYEATQRKFGRDCLDELIAKLDVEAIECSLECLFVELRNRACSAPHRYPRNLADSFWLRLLLLDSTGQESQVN